MGLCPVIRTVTIDYLKNSPKIKNESRVSINHLFGRVVVNVIHYRSERVNINLAAILACIRGDDLFGLVILIEQIRKSMQNQGCKDD